MAFSLNKLISYLPGQQSENQLYKRHTLSLEPEVGFRLFLKQSFELNEPNSNQNQNSSSKENTGDLQLCVNLIAARHLPSLFGLKTVQGYQIKVKLFPGSKRFESSVQLVSWPKFDEEFIFELISPIKSSLKHQNKTASLKIITPSEIFRGHFVVFTVYALLELPAGQGFNRFKGTYRSLKEKSNSLLKAKTENLAKSRDGETSEKPLPQMTISESRRNIGTVTCYLDSKIFNEDSRNGYFSSEEIWLPIRDITVTQARNTNNSVGSSAKGQVEIILKLSDMTNKSLDCQMLPETNKTDKKKGKKQWSINEIKKKVSKSKSKKEFKQLNLYISTTKLRLSIKVKEEFEAIGEMLYLKTAVYEQEIYSNAWKSGNFIPTLSIRWDPEQSTIIIPLKNEESLQNISIKTTLATKNKIGKKIILGSIIISPKSHGKFLEHWQKLFINKDETIAFWHNLQ